MGIRFDFAQVAPDGGELVPLYSVPAGASAILPSVLVCNRTPERRRFRLTLEHALEETGDEHYLYSDVPVPPYETFVATIGQTLPPGAVLRAYADARGLSFTAFAHEIE